MAAVNSDIESNAEEDQEEFDNNKEAPPEVEELEGNDDAESVHIDGDKYVAVDIYDNEYYARDNEEEHLFALTEHQGDKHYTPQEKECLVTYVEVNEHPAWTLWDSESTTTGITPQFAHVNAIHVHELTEPLMLQLGTVRSCAVVQFGAEVKIKTSGHLTKEYVDIANFDRYDMIIERVGVDSLECQPTSFRVKVEDLIIDEVKKQQSAVSVVETTDSIQSFWDRPVPPPDMQWAYDPPMLSE
ncbi:hypothetical protein C0995_006853 [Termitomyces sp. Mi166|nr:hypothetical protein C0995_006853 [Termitomyces sp. Mi166\